MTEEDVPGALPHGYLGTIGSHLRRPTRCLHAHFVELTLFLLHQEPDRQFSPGVSGAREQLRVALDLSERLRIVVYLSTRRDVDQALVRVLILTHVHLCRDLSRLVSSRHTTPTDSRIEDTAVLGSNKSTRRHVSLMTADRGHTMGS